MSTLARAGCPLLLEWLVVHVAAAAADYTAPVNGHRWAQHADTPASSFGAARPASPHRYTWHVAPLSAAGGISPPCHWTEGGSSSLHVLAAQRSAHALPRAANELRPLVCCDGSRHAKMCHPVGHDATT